MKWFYPITQWEYLLAAAFVTAYLLYVIRVVSAARRLGVFTGVIVAKFVLRAFYFGLMLVALLGPSFGEEQKEVRTTGRDIYAVVDLSHSMNATDLAPSRLARARFEIGRLLDRFPSDRIGLVVYTSEAFVQCPLTYDQSALRVFLNTLRPGLASGGGTNTAAALRVALEKHTDSLNTTLRNTSKVIVLVTDGEDFGEDARAVARDIAESGIRLFALGIGSEEGGRIPQGRSYKRLASGEPVVTRLARQSLQRLSRAADGQYFEITPTRNEMNRLMYQLSRVEGQLRDARTLDVSANKYYYFLLAALVLMALDVLVAVNTIQF
jgi:Ca-activated chloride channel family protein